MATKSSLTKKIPTVSSRVNTALNTLKSASAKAKLDTSNPFGFITDNKTIQKTMDAATNAAYKQKTKEATLGLNKAEDTAYANTQNSINELRKSMLGSASNGGSTGAAAATALQAMLGLGQQNSAMVTEGLQTIQGIAGEKAAALQQNAVDAISQANSAKASQATAANEKYNADSTRSAEALAALGGLAGTMHTNLYNKNINDATNKANIAMNNATNKANKDIAKTTQKQKITYAGGYKVK